MLVVTVSQVWGVTEQQVFNEACFVPGGEQVSRNGDEDGCRLQLTTDGCLIVRLRAIVCHPRLCIHTVYTVHTHSLPHLLMLNTHVLYAAILDRKIYQP